jgi:membrane protein insertase Oxa1/YidC/SpoIIIJ
MKKHGCAQWKSFLQMASAPLTITAFFAIRKMCVYEPDLEHATFLWIKDLSMPDPLMALPFVCASMFLMNFELNQRASQGGRSAMTLYIRWATRVGCFVFAYMASNQPAALFAYWIGMSMAGVIQPLLLRSTAFRSFFSFPPPPAAAQTLLGKDVKKVSLWERLTDSREVRLAKERDRAEQIQRLQAQAVKSKMQHIDEFEVVFGETKPKK